VDSLRLTWVEIDIARPADACYRLLCDVERLPRWVPGVAAVHVIERRPDGRAAVAEFIGMPNRGSFAYSLRYEYDDAAHTIRWEALERTLRDLTGEAAFTAVGDERCRLRYGLCATITNVLPDWARITLEDESPRPVVEAFRRWAEQQG
jgi:ribosome-associated toxin RatA of RatAB toxin-antitoxin module